MRATASSALLALWVLSTVGCPGTGKEHVYDFDGDEWVDAEDCQPENPEVHPGADDPYGDGIDSDCDGGDGIDRDGDGYAANAEGEHAALWDCNDADASVHPGADDQVGNQVDNDCDGHDGVDADGDTWASEASGGQDCDDADSDVHPLALELCGNGINDDCAGGIDDADLDQDTYVDEACDGGDDCDDTDPLTNPSAVETCGDGLDNDCNGTVDDRDLDGDGYVDEACDGGDDCDDLIPLTHPGAEEIVDLEDNDCDGVVDEDTDLADDDGDGYAEVEGDCNDAEPSVHPGAVEICGDGLDNDCSYLVDDLDADGDGFLHLDCGGMDCDDNNVVVNPAMPEICDNGLDDDCDGGVDDADADGDGFLHADCGGEDCDDSHPLIHPGALEVCGDQLDNNCDGGIDDLDLDGDGHLAAACGGDDCDDLNPATWLGAPELPDGLDNDCDNVVDNDTPAFDDDGDGYCEDPGGCIDPKDLPGDCDDADPAVHPAATEQCGNGVDDDCSQIAEDLDADGDGYVAEACGGPDCADGDPAIHPGADEVCDGVDNDCSATTHEHGDGDSDSYSICDGDCDDGDSWIRPGFLDLCGDGVDNDCDGGVDNDCQQCDQIVVGGGSIQDGIDAAGNGEIVCVGEGTYLETIDLGGKAIEVLGLAGPDTTTIDSDGAVPVVTFASGEGPDTLLQGFTITGAQGSGTQFGGGILIQGASPTLVDLELVANALDVGGGAAIYVENGTVEMRGLYVHLCGLDNGLGGGLFANAATVILEDSVLEQNVAYSGGAVYLQAGSTLTATDVDLSDNSATFGGGLYAWESTVEIDGGEFYRNQDIGSGSGTGVYLFHSEATLHDVELIENWGNKAAAMMIRDSDATITHATLSGNWALARAGAVYIEGDSHTTWSDVWLQENTAHASGGAMYIDGGNKLQGTTTMDHVHVLANAATFDGGGIYVRDVQWFDLSNVVVAGNTSNTDTILVQGGGGIAVENAPGALRNVAIVGNVASKNGGGLMAAGLTWNTVTLQDVVIAQNFALNGTGGGIHRSGLADLAVSYSDVWGNGPDEIDGMLPDPIGLSGNVSLDPEFMTVSDLLYPWEWDLHLGPASPLIDAGDPVLDDPDGSRSDMGAYGGPGADGWDIDLDGYFEWWLPGAYDPVTSPAMDCDDRDPGVYPGSGC